MSAVFDNSDVAAYVTFDQDLQVPGGGTLEARFNWWGDPSGPASPSNPGGQGDSIGGGSPFAFTPFLAAPPNFKDTPPVVRMAEPCFYAEPGDTLILQWEASDNSAIVSKRVLFAEHWELPNVVLADLPPGQRSLKFTVPVANPRSNNSGSFLRIEATDDSGQVGFDQVTFYIPYAPGRNSPFTITQNPRGFSRPARKVP